jgi:hypothetical protein
MPQAGIWTLGTVLAAACCVSGCGVASTAATASASYSAHAHASTSTLPDPATAAAVRRTPGEALVNWMHDVAAGNRRASCEDAAPPGTSDMAVCMSAAGTNGFNSLHGNFDTIGIKPSTPIGVTGGQVKGASATTDGNDIRVDGTTLNELEVRHSTGVKSGQLDFSWDLLRVDGAWYVTNMNMNLG